MLKTQRTWRLFNPPGEPVTEIEDPRASLPILAISLRAAVVVLTLQGLSPTATVSSYGIPPQLLSQVIA